MKHKLISLLILTAVLTLLCTASAWAAGSDEPVIHGVGVKLQELSGTKAVGYPVTDLQVGGSIDFRAESTAKAARDIDYWVINGAIYHLNMQQTSITFRDVTSHMTVECVLKGQSSRTAEIHGHLEDDQLTVQTINAKMCFIKKLSFATNAGAGGYFREFDFTQNYKNRATKKEEDGGRITVRVVT